MKNKDKYDLRDISYAIECDDCKYEFVVYYTFIEIHRESFCGCNSRCGAFTKWLEEESPSILTDEEKAYLSAVIKPFREEVETIEKTSFATYEQLQISDGYTVMAFPCFKAGTMYKGMEEDRDYTLGDLGL